MRRIGRYRLDSVQGVGAFATVWRGWDEQLLAPVAVKLLADNWTHHPDVCERFLEEARILRRIVDERVVRVHDVGVDDGRPYFVMDFAPGGTVADLIGHVDPRAAISIAAAASRAIQVLHTHGVLHRDIKPSNLLLDDGRVLVSDLGSAKHLAEASGITVTTGTPAYMSPEQLRGDPLDVRSDVYSLGVLTYELLTGSAAIPSRRSAMPSGVSREVEKALTAAVAPKSADRPASAEAFAASLERGTSTAAANGIPVMSVFLMMLTGFVASAALVAWLMLV